MKYDDSGRIEDLQKCLGSGFLEIENPARYLGSEYIHNRKHYTPGDVKCCMCFPDLYEIGMANNAVRILYDIINRTEGAYCDRVFAVAPDFEAMLREKKIPLFTLQEHFPLNQMDYLGISIGYELCATNILQVLDLGHIPIEAKNRKEGDPIVFAGGPASTNPLPFSKFFDFIHIGEAEPDLSNIIRTIGKYKTRKERVVALKQIPCLWYPGKKLANRAVDTTFGTPDEHPRLEHFAIASFETAQDHGVVEIMRGCPNGCRFCHAGQYYKPFRQRNLDTVFDLVDQNVEQATVTVDDVTSNPKGFVFEELNPEVLPNILDSVDAAIINGYFAIAAGLDLSTDLYNEKVTDGYINVIAVREADADSELTKTIDKIVHSDAFRNAIEDESKQYKSFTKPEGYYEPSKFE